jgi:outer membrane protein OmpA-like peptidoglycan-associated protein
MRQYRAWFVGGGIIAAILAVLTLRGDVGAWMLAAKMKLWPETRQAETRPPATLEKSDAKPVNPVEQTRAPIEAQQAQPLERTGGSRKDEYKFDVVRIDPEGASVFAGRAPANSTVTVLANEQPIATPKADNNGEWAAVVERKFTAGEYKLALASKPGQPADGQSVNLTVPRVERAAVAPAKETVAVPKEPITFLYNEAEFTPEGYRAAAVLSQYVRARGLTVLTLSGHADERGSYAYNMELSRQRLAAVERYLRARGFDGKLLLLPKGDLEPFAVPNRNALERDHVYQLDRRVELRVYR